jgi:RNA polymerase sigma-70 factor (family 1)
VQPQPPYQEKDLLARIAAGDENAFTQVFEMYRQRLYNYLLSITKFPVIAEDIVVDVFMKLWVGRELLTNVRDLEGFLHKVAYNKAMDFFTTTARHTRLLQVYAERIDNNREKTADELMVDDECRRILLEAVNQLPPQRKLIYTLSREQGLTHEQIAHALNLSRNTVKNSIVTATRSISEYLQKYYPGKTALSCLFFLS